MINRKSNTAAKDTPLGYTTSFFKCHCGNIVHNKKFCDKCTHWHFVNGQAMECNGGLLCEQLQKQQPEDLAKCWLWLKKEGLLK